MTEQRQFLLSLPQLNLGFVKPHGTPGVYSGDFNEVYVLLRLPRGGHNLVLNRHYHAIGFLSPKDALNLRDKFAPVVTSEWEGAYQWNGFQWKDSLWYNVDQAKCPTCGNDNVHHYATKKGGFLKKCSKCGRFRKQWKS